MDCAQRNSEHVRHEAMRGFSKAAQPALLAPTAKSICVVVVAFFPDQAFVERLRGLLPQVGALVVVDNTPEESCVQQMRLLVEEGRVHVIENRANLGIAAALNQGLERAVHLGYQWILTLDQDSQCYVDMVETLVQVYAVCEPKPAVIGGNYFDPRNGQLAVPTAGVGIYLERKTVITSGSLVDAALARSIGSFREDYFIDQVDHEFCLRVRAHGYRVVISRKPVMAHSVGGLGGARVPFFGILPKHLPLRKYYIARNTVVTVADYWRREPEWCLRRLVRLILGLCLMATLEEKRFAKIRAFMAGIVDAVLGRMGPCHRQWLRQVSWSVIPPYR